MNGVLTDNKGGVAAYFVKGQEIPVENGMETAELKPGAVIHIDQQVQSEMPVVEQTRALRVEDLHPSPVNPRKTFKDLAELGETIKSKGLIQPIVVRAMVANEEGREQFEIIVGERRYRAALIAGVEVLPGFVREYSDAEVLDIMFIENIHRETFNPLEEARAFQTWKESGVSVKDIAFRIQHYNLYNPIRNLHYPYTKWI